MDTLNLNKEWNFITQEINSGDKGGTRKGEMLFEFQILLSAFLKTKSPINGDSHHFSNPVFAVPNTHDAVRIRFYYNFLKDISFNSSLSCIM